MNKTRRHILTGSMAAGAALIGAPYIKSARSAGTLKLGIWDHWVPGTNAAIEKICTDWGAANNVEVSVDFITSMGNKLDLTAQAESRAKVGHDILAVPLWLPAIHAENLEPMDDVIAELIAQNGPLAPVAEYLAKIDDVWRAVPAPTGTFSLGMVSRLDLMRDAAGIDLRALFPAGPRDAGAVAAWTWEAFLETAEKLHAAGHPFGAPIAPGADSQTFLGEVFSSYGSVLVDASGDVVVDSDQTREVLDYMTRLAAFMPESVYSWDDASNNRFLISGQGSVIINAPSAWAVSKRDTPDIAAQLWHHDVPAGPAGRFRSFIPFFWGMWQFSQNKTAAKDLLVHVNQRPQVETMLQASQGYDVPLSLAFGDSSIWDAAGPPAGVLYNYPIRGDEQAITGAWPAPPRIGAGIFSQGIMANMVARVTADGESHDDAISWAEDEIAGLMRD